MSRSSMAQTAGLITILGELTFAEQINEVYQYATQGKQGNAEVEQKRAQLIQQANAATDDAAKQQAIIKDVVMLLNGQGEGNDREIEGIFNLIADLVITHFDDAQATNLLQHVFTILNSEASSTSDKAIVRYRILSNIFNALPQRSPNRCFAFKTLLDAASSNDDLDVISDALEAVPQWLAEWDVPATEKAEVLMAISQVLEAAGESKQAYHFLQLHLRFLSTSSLSGAGSSAAATKAAAESTVAAALSLPNVFDFDELASTAAVQALQNEPIGTLLNIFLNGKTQDWVQWSQSNGQEIQRLNLLHAQLERKIRLLDLVRLCSQSQSRSVPYADIAKTLDISIDDVEIWVIDVIRAGLVSGKLSEIDQSLRVYKSVHRTFEREQWRQLEQRLSSWEQSIEGILQTLSEARQTGSVIHNANGGVPRDIGIPGADSATAASKQAMQQSQITA